jgi:hypothetical protein
MKGWPLPVAHIEASADPVFKVVHPCDMCRFAMHASLFDQERSRGWGRGTGTGFQKCIGFDCDQRTSRITSNLMDFSTEHRAPMALEDFRCQLAPESEFPSPGSESLWIHTGTLLVCNLHPSA